MHFIICADKTTENKVNNPGLFGNLFDEKKVEVTLKDAPDLKIGVSICQATRTDASC